MQDIQKKFWADPAKNVHLGNGAAEGMWAATFGRCPEMWIFRNVLPLLWGLYCAGHGQLTDTGGNDSSADFRVLGDGCGGDGDSTGHGGKQTVCVGVVLRRKGGTAASPVSFIGSLQ